MLLVPFALVVGALAGLMWRQVSPARAPSGSVPVTASVRRELTRLDPFSFFVLSGREFGVDHVVVGGTGTFAIRVGQESVDGRFRREVLEARRGAKRVRRAAGSSAVHTRVQPMLCLPGRQFAPRTVRGVKVIPWGVLVTEIVQGRRDVTPHQTQRVAEALGGIPKARRLAG
jgi:hypothetical protein